MIKLPDSVFPPRNIGTGSQLTLLKGMDTVTVRASPGLAVAGSGVTVVVWPERPELLMKVLTAVVTSSLLLPGSVALRAPTRAPLVRICSTIIRRLNSIMPKTRRTRTGTTTANSTAAAARRAARQRSGAWGAGVGVARDFMIGALLSLPAVGPLG